jgi:hypothetical protein
VKGEYETIERDLRFERISMKAIDGSEFPFVRILLKSDLSQIPRRRLKVFVGHRFVDHITQPLRFNLARILDPYYKSLFTELALKLPSFIYQRVRPSKRIRRT